VLLSSLFGAPPPPDDTAGTGQLRLACKPRFIRSSHFQEWVTLQFLYSSPRSVRVRLRIQRSGLTVSPREHPHEARVFPAAARSRKSGAFWDATSAGLLVPLGGNQCVTYSKVSATSVAGSVAASGLASLLKGKWRAPAHGICQGSPIPLREPVAREGKPRHRPLPCRYSTDKGRSPGSQGCCSRLLPAPREKLDEATRLVMGARSNRRTRLAT